MSEHRSIEEALRGAGEFLRSVLQHGSDIFTILEADGTIRYESPSIERVLGYKPEELLGGNVFNYVHPEDLEQAWAAFAGVVADRGATCRESVDSSTRTGPSAVSSAWATTCWRTRA
jgi:PAS domain S-box-containing protein